MKVAGVDPVATFWLRGALRRRIKPHLGTQDRKLQVEMREGVLDAAG